MEREKFRQLLCRDFVPGGVPVGVVGEINCAASRCVLLQRGRQIEELDFSLRAKIAKEIVLRETVCLNVSGTELHVIVTAGKVERVLQFIRA